MANPSATAWNNLVSCFVGVAFNTDVAGSNLSQEVIGVDNFCYTAGNCCTSIPSSAFTITRSCTNGNFSVTATPSVSAGNHVWELFETSVEGSTLDAHTIDANPATPALDPVQVQTGSTAHFQWLDINKFYYIKHKVGEPCCPNNSETRIAIFNYKLTNTFNFETAAGIVKTQFCYGENIYLDGTASTGENQYFIDAWRKPIGAPGNYSYYAGLGWTSGQIGIVNLSQLFANLANPVYFEPGYEYSIKLALSNTPNCIGWTPLEHQFTVVCCDGFLDGCFKVNVNYPPGSDVGILEANNFNTYANIGAVHEWYVLSSPNIGAGPYTPVASLTSTTQNPVLLYTNAEDGLNYTIIHKVKTACGEFCTMREQRQTGLKLSLETTDSEECKPVDCCFVNDYWPTGPGESQPFTAEFDMITSTNGNLFTIQGTPLYNYGNNSSITHQWYLFSSPNPDGGPYTLVHQSTNSTYTSPSLPDGLYYFLIHRVKSPCGEDCFGRRVNHLVARTTDGADCTLCGDIDCAIVDSLITPCKTPANLISDCRTGVLSWDAVPGATGYTVEITYNDPNCCRSPYQPFSNRFEVTGNSYTIRSIPINSIYCISWKVMAHCGKEGSAWSRSVCMDCSGGGIIGKASPTGAGAEQQALNPVIAPNPNKGSMNLYLDAPGNLTLSVDIYGATGKLVHNMKQKTIPGGKYASTINLPGTEKGLYTVVFKTNYGVFTRKVVVQ
ncbi:MAG: T9SS type A sorting domain-containing protein [Dinghuibacter sp.]|nr:T9SS type A sorting domain-containing protein [Dinghuibacter sp.]